MAQLRLARLLRRRALYSDDFLAASPQAPNRLPAIEVHGPADPFSSGAVCLAPHEPVDNGVETRGPTAYPLNGGGR